jgi:hypothetical protein
MAGKGRHGERGKARPFVQLKAGADIFRKTGKWNEREKVEDRDHDRYHERIVDPETGVVLYECHEPLSAHRGHGSTKRRNDSRD